MSDALAQQISLFRSLIKTRRFDDATLRILESVLVSKSAQSLKEVESSLRALLRSESLSTIREIVEKPIRQKLLVLDFFVRAFALIADVESCLALRYEALHMRELESASCHWLEVSYLEWLNFAEHSLDNGFYSIAGKAFEKAILCHKGNDIANPKVDEFFENVQVLKIKKRLEDFAMTSAASCSEFTGSMTMDDRRKLSKVMSCRQYRLRKKCRMRKMQRLKNEITQLTLANAQLEESINAKEQACASKESEYKCLVAQIVELTVVCTELDSIIQITAQEAGELEQWRQVAGVNRSRRATFL